MKKSVEEQLKKSGKDPDIFFSDFVAGKRQATAVPPAAGEEPSLPVHELVSSELAAAQVLRTTTNHLENAKLREILDLITVLNGTPEQHENAKLLLALKRYEALAPTDVAEGMLAAQMIGTHSAAMECLRRAADNTSNFLVRDESLKQAMQLLALYAKQLAALDKHRGKGQQKVTVEHVNVGPGGQAMVGVVEMSGSRAAKAPPALEHSQESPLPDLSKPIGMPLEGEDN